LWIARIAFDTGFIRCRHPMGIGTGHRQGRKDGGADENGPEAGQKAAPGGVSRQVPCAVFRKIIQPFHEFRSLL
jgi:hypothetical protein